MEQLKNQILIGVQAEQSDALRKKMCDIASELARNLIDEDNTNHWPQFLQFLFQCANSPAPALKESALRMFTYVILSIYLFKNFKSLTLLMLSDCFAALYQGYLVTKKQTTWML